MAWLEEHPTSGHFKICFRLGSRKLKKTIKTTSREEAEGALLRFQQNLNLLLPDDTNVRARLRQLLGTAKTAEAVKVAVALALVEADDQRHEDIPAAEVLVNAMRHAAKTDRLFQPPRSKDDDEDRRRCPWVGGKLRFRLCQALCSWSEGDDGRMHCVLPALLVGLRAANGYTAATDIGPILSWLWPGRDIRMNFSEGRKPVRELPPKVTAEEMTGIQRAVIEACYANAGIWEPKIGHTDLAFMRVGLPPSRAELGKLVT
jgi:hypothetical protein